MSKLGLRLTSGLIVIVCSVLGFSSASAVVSRNVEKELDTIPRNTLILLRHAKSDKSNLDMPDIMRPLEESGRKEAEQMGDSLRTAKLKIDAIISSPSVRTRQTLEIICKRIDYSFDSIVWDSTLYACSGDHLISKIKSTNPKYKTVMYVGHNPATTIAANGLQLQQNIDEVKTCGIVAIDFPCCGWSTVSKESGALRFYQKPK